jgi:oxygen-dependent protoporphyrinogen oxidase
MTRRVVVVGAGVGGLATAHRLLHPHADAVGADARVDVTVLEASRRVGGKVDVVDLAGVRLPAGPDAFVARKPWAVELCRELGLGDRLVAPGTNGAFVWTDRGLVRFPEGGAMGIPGDVEAFARWPGLPRAARLRAALDLLKRPRRDDADESIGSLVRRRLGDGVAEALIQPLLGGLFAGDIDRLSVRATFPELVRWEREHESLIRGARAAIRSATQGSPMFLTPRGGVSELVDALLGSVGTERIRLGVRPSLRLGEAEEGNVPFVVDAGDGPRRAHAVVLAVPAFEAAGLLGGFAPAAAAELSAIRYVSTGVVSLVYPEGTAERLPDATGFVAPRGKAPMTAATFLSRKWPDAAFGTRAVVRCFVGGDGSEDLLESDDDDLITGVARHLAAVVDLPTKPEAAAVTRWERAMPQYDVGHLERIERIAASLPEGTFLAGAAYRGVGVPDVVRGADEAAARVREHLFGRRESEQQETAWTS